MLATATDVLNGSAPPLRLMLDEESTGVLEGNHNGVRAFIWGQVFDEDRRALSPEALCQRVATGAGISGLRGHYALVLVDGNGARVRIVSDRFVTRRLYYTLVQGEVWVSDSISCLRRALPDSPSIAPQAVLDYLFFHMVPSPDTIYEGIYALAPAEVAEVKAGRLERYRHWKPIFTADTHADEQAQAGLLFSTLEAAVTDTLDETPTGCFLSGGLDSSSIAGLVARKRPGVPVFSIGFPLEQYNELDYARCAVERFGLTGHEYCMYPEDVVEALPTIIDSMDQPFGNSSVLPTYFCARLAKSHGVDRLIAGDGGDELFAGNVRYSKQLQMDRWRQRLGPLVPLLAGGLLNSQVPSRPAILRKGKSFVRQLRMSVTENLEYFNFLNLIDRRSVFAEALLGSLDLKEPERRCQRLYDELPQADTLDRMLYMDWKHTLADNDLVKVSSACRLANIEVAYPMLDDGLVDLSLCLPARLKLTPNNLRHLYKVAMSDFLPQRIINKPKHGFGLPFGLWTQNHPELRAQAHAALDGLKAYNLFQPRFLDEVKRLHQHEHAKHYGELVWVLMVLSLWLDRNQQ
ncbi:asparagine synthetase B [Motiliproteus sp. SC1-56]|uniref:asparagine synthetase B family protein n=1 Tax=Motiliproteus sp. SC1-56 TaxID=2799565 RepID=UPI001A8EA5CA|nr:asparagine synthase-related protein [Motiliproteus sp. SC1-56]